MAWSWLEKSAQAIYTGTDFVLLGALPDYGADSALPAGGFTADTSLIGALLGNTGTVLNTAAQDAGELPANLTTGLPTTGTNLGTGVGNLGYYSLTGVGAGAGNALGSVGSGLGSGLGDLGGGLGKGLLPIALIAAGLVLVLVLSTRGRNVNAGPVAVSGGAA